MGETNLKYYLKTLVQIMIKVKENLFVISNLGWLSHNYF